MRDLTADRAVLYQQELYSGYFTLEYPKEVGSLKNFSIKEYFNAPRTAHFDQ